MKKLQVGIVGFGRIGNEHAGWLSNCKSLSPKVVFDPTPERRAKAESMGLPAFDTLDQLIKSDIEVVLISTPTAMHCQHAMLALAGNKHVMIEKPMALDLPQSRQLIECAAANHKVLSVFHNRRWDIDYLTVKQAIDSGQFGKVFNIESRLGQWSSCVGPAAREWRPGWRNEAAFGGGGLYDWGSHFIDQLQRLLLPAKPLRVFAQLHGNVWTQDCDDFARVCVDFDNGCCGMVEINTTTTRPLPRWHIDGSSGSAESPFSLEFDSHKWAEVSFTPANGDAPFRLPLAEPGFTDLEIWEKFAAAVRGEGVPAVTAESVLSTMALLDAGRESGKSGMVVVL